MNTQSAEGGLQLEATGEYVVGRKGRALTGEHVVGRRGAPVSGNR